MKILLSTYFYLPHVGGLSTYIDNLKQELEHMGHEVDVFAHHPDMQNYYMPNNGATLYKPKIKDLVYAKVYPFFEQNMPHVEPWIRWREIERYCFAAAAVSFGLKQYDLIHTQDIVSTKALWRVKPRGTPLLTVEDLCESLGDVQRERRGVSDEKTVPTSNRGRNKPGAAGAL